MKRFEAFGSIMIILGAGILTGYGMYLFIQAQDVPVIIRLGAVTIFAGILLILLSLVKERILERKGGFL
jgi:uncharacterized membrane protein